MEHKFSRDGCLSAVDLGGAALKCRDHLLHHFIEENMRQLGMEKRTELEGDLRDRVHTVSMNTAQHTRLEAVGADVLTEKSTVQVLG